MKKQILFIIVIIISFVSCDITSPSQDLEMLQKDYKTVYRVDISNYVTIDTLNKIYHINVTNNGSIYSKIEIR